MSNVNWSKITHFPELKSRPDIENVQPELLYKLNDFRSSCGFQIVASPVIGAIVATSGHSPKSYHYKGMAIDVFCLSHPLDVVAALFNYNPFGGIGFYFDTFYNNKPHVMNHFDIRPLKSNYKRTWWFRDNKTYYYVNNFKSESDFFLTLIKKCEEFK